MYTTAVAQWLRCCATNRKVAGSIPPGVSGFFIDIKKILLIALLPCGRLSLEQKWVPGVFPGGKSGRCLRLTTLLPSCAVVTKSGSLNFLEPSWPVHACNRTDLPLYIYIYIYTRIYHSFLGNWTARFYRCKHTAIRKCTQHLLTESVRRPEDDRYKVETSCLV